MATDTAALQHQEIDFSSVGDAMTLYERIAPFERHEEMTKQLENMTRAGMDPKDVVLTVLDAIITGVRWGNW